MSDNIKTERNLGIDALRVVSMFGIVLMHIMYKGGLLRGTSELKSVILWLIEVMCCCAVNCYGMISGYVMCSDSENRHRYKKFLKLWLGVFFWSFGISLFFALYTKGGIDQKILIKSAFPILTGEYWYFSAYTVLFFLVPWINKLIQSLSDRELTKLCAVLFILFSVAGLITDPFKIDFGYSFPWLIFMYIVGAWIKKCDVASKLKNKKAILISALCVTISLTFLLVSPIRNDILIKYNSPTTVIYGACLVCVFSKLRFKGIKAKVIRFMAPAVFGVYIIHEHPMIKCCFEDWFGWILYLSALGGVGCVLISGVVLYAVCITAEKLRIYLFKALRLQKKR